ncbi:MAG: hypothetical protein JNJ84_16920 [Rhodobacteraceae bacterium]|nr:hypothetical protein [Paracoccaceae bacterium]
MSNLLTPTRRQFGALVGGTLAAAMINRRAAAGTLRRARVFVPPLNATGPAAMS